MRWTRKAQVQRVCAALPAGDVLYRSLQRRLGTLAPDPFKRLPAAARMLRGLSQSGVDIQGARCLEVGTGHMPIAPVVLWLAGARQVVTIDLHRRLDVGMTAGMLRNLVEQRPRVAATLEGLVDLPELDERLETIREGLDDPLSLLRRIGVDYQAPADATRLRHGAGEVDVHLSFTTLEHIHPDALLRILAEASRVIERSGVAAHFIDLSDHFAHHDSSISRINFLRFDERTWKRLAANEFSYTNRLRAHHYEELFAKAGLAIFRADRVVDPGALAALADGLPVDEAFRDMTAEQLCTTTLALYARSA